MAVTYTFPTSEELTAIEQEKLPTLTMQDPIFTWFPLESVDSVNLRFEQEDNYTGLMQLRGVGGEPNRVARKGAKSYIYEPGVYGEFISIDEKEILERRPYGTWDGFIGIDALVMKAQDQLLNRRIDRIRWILWTLVTTGSFFVPTFDANGAATQGAAGHGDQYVNVTGIGQYGMQTFTASPAWSSKSTATPLLDLRNLQQTAQLGRSVDFGPTAVAVMNSKTYINMIGNTNAADLGGKKSGNFNSTLTSVSDINTILLDAGLPQIMVYDGFYIDDTNTAIRFVPDNTVMVMGGRTNGANVGNFRFTRNVNNDNMAPGPYTVVNDLGAVPNMKAIPRVVQVHDGYNGGPVIYYPSCIIRMAV